MSRKPPHHMPLEHSKVNSYDRVQINLFSFPNNIHKRFKELYQNSIFSIFSVVLTYKLQSSSITALKKQRLHSLLRQSLPLKVPTEYSFVGLQHPSIGWNSSSSRH